MNLVLLFLLGLTGFAKLMPHEEAPVLYKNLSYDIHVSKNGASREIETWEALIQTVQGKGEMATISVAFDSTSEKVRVLEAYTLTQGRKYKLSKANLSEKDSASANSGFSKIRELIMSFPQVEVGSTLYYRTERTFFSKTLAPFWSRSLALPARPIEKFEVKVRGEVPLYQQAIDPRGLFEMQKIPRGYIVKNKKPFTYQVEEEDNSFFSDLREPYLQFSTADRWDERYPTFFNKINDLAKVPLPKDWQPEINRIKSLGSDQEKFQAVHQLIRNKFRYWGDWRSQENNFIPRPLKEILASQYGDCKDFTLLGMRLLRDLGYQAHPALIRRINTAVSKDFYKLPTLQAFNHMIVYMEHGGRDYWFDFTNTHYYYPVRDDLDDRYALVPKNGKSLLVLTPPLKAEDGQVFSEVFIEPEVDGNTAVQWKSRYQGWLTPEVASQFEYYNQKSLVRDYIIGQFPWVNIVSSSIKRSSSPKQEDLDIQFSTKNMYLYSNLGLVFRPPLVNILRKFSETEFLDRHTDFLFGVPYKKHIRFVFKSKTLKNPVAMKCQLENAYFSFDQKARQEGSDVVFDQIVELRQKELVMDPSLASEVQKLKNELNRCGNSIALVFN